VSQASSMNSLITHWVFFDFVDLSDNVAIGEPSLPLTASVPSGAQNATILFGPSSQSTSFTVNLVGGDPRFDAWTSGQGDVSGQLAVYFSNTTMNAFGLQFFPGTESGEFSGSFSVMYNYVPVPEPNSLALSGAGLLLLAWTSRRHRKVWARGKELCSPPHDSLKPGRQDAIRPVRLRGTKTSI